LIPNLLQSVTGYTAGFGTDVLPADVISPFSVSKRIKQIFLSYFLRIRLAAENFAVAPAYRHPRAAASGKHPMHGFG
jgi:hypothetical protein